MILLLLQFLSENPGIRKEQIIHSMDIRNQEGKYKGTDRFNIIQKQDWFVESYK